MINGAKKEELPCVVCIIGMHRSGTSMVAGLLKLSGLELGREDNMVGANSSNVKGHFEHLGFLEINDALLKHLGGSWDNPPTLELGWERDSSLDNLTRQARELIATFSSISCWGWKDPRTTILLPFWQKLVSNMRYVICVRNPLDVAKSLGKRDAISTAAAAELWHQYTGAAIRHTEGLPRIFSFYEDYFISPVNEVNRVTEFCGFSKVTDKFRFGEVISAELRNQASEAIELLQEVAIPLEYKLFYLGLRALWFGKSPAEADDPRKVGGGTSDSGKFSELMDDFRRQELLAQAQTAVAKKELEINELRKIVLQLEQDNARYQKFSDAVRATWAYRLYKTFNNLSFRHGD